MSIKLYSTLTRNKEEFVPVDPQEVKMYLCGPTVYDLLHIGNFRGPVAFNLIRNWLEYRGYKVNFVYNYTDVDDKIINKATAQGKTASEVSEHYIEEFEKDFNRLGLKKHTHNPRVTTFMPQIIAFVQDLITNKKAYEINGEVFYAIDTMDDYGKLSGKKIDELEAGQRVEVDIKKKNPADFVLWKPAKPGDPYWDSPWGKGRPGWHIECSAMIQSILGETIDIHGGGIDLIFPHHENEIAQGEGRTGKCYCKYWMHNQFINMNNQKMSKSLGNIKTMRDFMDEYHPEIFKYLCLSVHYRSSFSVDDEKIIQVVESLRRIYEALESCRFIMAGEQGNALLADKQLVAFLKDLDSKIEESMDDDFNSSEMIAFLFAGVRYFNQLAFIKKKKSPEIIASCFYFSGWMKKYSEISALFNEEPESFLDFLNEMSLKIKNIDKRKIMELMNKREEARLQKDWMLADSLKNELQALGVELRDGQKRNWEIRL